MASTLAFVAIGFLSGIFLTLPKFLLVLMTTWSVHTGFAALWGKALLLSSTGNWLGGQLGFFCAVLIWIGYEGRKRAPD